MAFQQVRYQLHVHDSLRTFHHRWFSNGRIIECEACSNTVAKFEPYYKHWETNTTTAHHLKLSDQDNQNLQLINDKGIESFLLCNSGHAKDTKHFLLDAAQHAVPNLLRMLFYKQMKLNIDVGFYACLHDTEELLVESGEVTVSHHYDINDIIDAVFTMLLEYIEKQMEKIKASYADIKRIRINVKRFKAPVNGAVHQLSVPLRYLVKNATVKKLQSKRRRSYNVIDLHTNKITNTFRLYRGNPSATHILHELNVNLYCFRLCRNNFELFAVPYYLSDEKNYLVPSYIILDDIVGEFQKLVEITNVPRFLFADIVGGAYTCSECNMEFEQAVTLRLHQMLHCGRHVKMSSVALDSIEIYEHCKRIDYDVSRWVLWAIWEE